MPINTAARGKLLRYYLEQSDLSVLFVDDALYDRVAEAKLDAKAIQAVVLMSLAAGTERRETLGARTYRYSQDLTGGFDDPIAVSPDCHDPALMAYTSGTTGPSKGNMLSQAAASARAENVDHHGYRPTITSIFACRCSIWVRSADVRRAVTAGARSTLARRFSVSGSGR